MDNKKTIIKKYIPVALFAVSFIILFIRCFYSFCWSDETFYFSTTYRFYQGDSIFVNDWFPTQLSSVVLLPLFSLYMALAGSTTGILLYFRILYLFFAAFNSVLTFRILKKHTGFMAALTCSAGVLFFVHLNIATLSYYTLSVQCFFMTMLLIYSDSKAENNRYLITAGIYYAVSVLALPTMAIAYFLTLFVFLILSVTSGTALSHRIFGDRLKHGMFFRIFKYTFIGICAVAVIFFTYMLLTVSIPDFIANIPYVLSDDEHGTSFIYPLKKFFIGINEVFGYFAYVYYLLISVCFLFGKHLSKKPFSYMILAADILLFICCLTRVLPHTGYMNTVICLFGLPLFFITEKKDLPAFFTFFLNGMIFSLVYSYSSNGYLYILSMGHFIASAASIIFIQDFITGLQEETIQASGESMSQRILSVIPVIIFSLFILITADLRIVNVYRDAPLSDLTETIPDGPAKGLKTTPDHLAKYNDATSVIKEFCVKEAVNGTNDSLLISKLLPFGYLCSDMQIGAPTTWRNMISSERLLTYYRSNPDKFPDVVLIMKDEYGAYDSCGDVEADPSPNENEISGALYERLQEDDYEKIEVKCGTIYRRR